MKVLFRKFSILVISLIAFSLIFGLLSPPSKSSIASDFNKNREDIVLVTNFLVNLKYESIYIPDFDESGVVFAGLEEGDIHIESVEGIAAIDRLINHCGYQVIDKEANTIHFLKWANKDCGRGVVYSIDGLVPNEASLDFLTYIEPLTEPNWYYYEEDFNKWKSIEKRQDNSLLLTEFENGNLNGRQEAEAGFAVK